MFFPLTANLDVIYELWGKKGKFSHRLTALCVYCKQPALTSPELKWVSRGHSWTTIQSSFLIYSHLCWRRPQKRHQYLNSWDWWAVKKKKKPLNKCSVKWDQHSDSERMRPEISLWGLRLEFSNLIIKYCLLHSKSGKHTVVNVDESPIR